MAAPKHNLNAEKYTLEVAIALLEEAIRIAEEKDHDFIGEVAREMKVYRDLFTYLKDKFKECKPLYKYLTQICEANCFAHGKTGDIIPSLSIMNLKANHGWSDRVETTNTTNMNIKSVEPISWVDNEYDKEEDAED